MFKKRIIYALITSSTLYLAVNSAYALPVTDGTINFTGKVVDASCTVAAGSVSQTIPLDPVSTTLLKTAGDTANPTNVPIVLEECNTNTSNTVQVVFSGNSIPGDSTVLSLVDGGNSATQVGIKLYDSENNEIKLDEPTAPISLTTGQTTLNFMAKYYALGQAGAGDVNATATFTMIYP
ncbi:fimbrial protein [Klebsiella aerogenes]|uniref:fimbrial protein n=1 Tax=Klebsiella aerogenes TaxID=548 RepID=UPI001CC74BB3|nr:fimbrial protein [Klebsiella aerogenes]UNX72221.1 type 1 fimbrial protein [Klebsiella aerogenes]HBR6963865.1 type 1 fimbrial protein [Klebsiella aerogenes]HBY1606520.1 type 1 fimbrial protein [Klebsiella aerogenes]